MNHQIYSLRLERRMARKFPFERVYFVPRDKEELLPRIFRSALVFPASVFFRMPGWPARERIAPGRAFPQERFDEARLREQVTGLEALYSLDHRKYFTVVPYLFTSPRRAVEGAAEASSPHYFMNRAVHSKSEFRLHDIDYENYLVFRGQVFTPICSVCPRTLLHFSHQCHFGARECFDEFSLLAPSEFREAYQSYQQLRGTLDEEDREEDRGTNRKEEPPCPASTKPA